MSGSVVLWRTCRVLSTCIGGVNSFSLSSCRLPFRNFSQDLMNSSPSCKFTSPVVLQICRRHSSLGTTINKSVNRYFFSHRPVFMISSLRQIQYPSPKLTQSLHRLFSSQQTGIGRTHKQTGSYSSQWDRANRTTVTYMTALAIAVVGLSYAAVPLYRIFCQASGYGGTVSVVDPSEKVENMEPLRERELTIRFNADTSAAMRWQFKPHQREIKLVPGETALAFYTARNPTDRAVTGIATYNVIPYEAGLYFNKIQCFCFEEQRLNPREQVDMPVFFYIDPDFNEDPAMARVETITLSYTFFEAKEGEQLTLPLPHTAPNS